MLGDSYFLSCSSFILVIVLQFLICNSYCKHTCFLSKCPIILSSHYYPPTKSLLPKSAPTLIVCVYMCGGGVSSCISSETRKCPRGWFLISFFFSKDHTSFQVRWTEGPLRHGTFFPTSQDTGELGTNTMLSKHRMEPLPSDA